jgi:hypothetical protein
LQQDLLIKPLTLFLVKNKPNWQLSYYFIICFVILCKYLICSKLI